MLLAWVNVSMLLIGELTVSHPDPPIGGVISDIASLMGTTYTSGANE